MVSALAVAWYQFLKIVIGTGSHCHTGKAADIDHLDRSAAAPQRRVDLVPVVGEFLHQNPIRPRPPRKAVFTRQP